MRHTVDELFQSRISARGVSMTLAVVSNYGPWSIAAVQPLPSPVLSQPSKIATSLPVISAQSSVSGASSSQSGSASTGSASDSAVPESVLEALLRYVSPTQQAWNDLTQSLRLGDLSTAQNAFSDYMADLAAPSNSSMLVATTPSAQFLAYLKPVGDALAAGNLEDARPAFATAAQWRPDTAAEAVSSAQGEVEDDGSLALYKLEHTGAGSISDLPLAADIAGLDEALREEQANISDELVALGFSASDAGKYSESITGIGNGSATDDAQVDAARASAWIQGLVGAAQTALASHGPSDQVANDLSGAPATLLNGIEFASIDGRRQLQTLLDATLSPSSGSSGTASTPNAAVSAVAGARLNSIA